MLPRIFFPSLICILALTACGELTNSDLVSLREKHLREEFVGNEIPLVEYKSLISAPALVPEYDPAGAYEVDSRVGIEGNYYIYNVHTPHGTYTIRGLQGLVSYCNDARIVEMFLNSQHGNTLMAGVSDYIGASGQGVVNLISHPGDSLSGIGRSFEAKTKSLESGIKSDFKSAEQPLDGINRHIQPGSSMYGDTMRQIAYHLRLNAYSLNPAVDGLLEHLARNEEIGRAFTSVVTWVVPGGSVVSGGADIAAWDQQGLNPGGNGVKVEQFIRDNDAGEALQKLAFFYKKFLGLDSGSGTPVGLLLANESYSPRQQAYIAYYLYDMRSSKGIGDAVKYLAATRTAFAAIYNTTQLQMIHAVHREYSPVVAFVPMQQQLAMINSSRQLIVIPLWGHTRERAEVRSLLVESRNTAAKFGGTAHIWFVGDCDDNVITTGRVSGISVRRNVAMDSTFRFTCFRLLTYKRGDNDPVLQEAGTVNPDPDMLIQRNRKSLDEKAQQ